MEASKCTVKQPFSGISEEVAFVEKVTIIVVGWRGGTHVKYKLHCPFLVPVSNSLLKV